MVRICGARNLFNRGKDNSATLVFRADHRHSYTDMSPQNSGLAAGSSMVTGSLFSDRGWELYKNLEIGWTSVHGKLADLTGKNTPYPA